MTLKVCSVDSEIVWASVEDNLLDAFLKCYSGNVQPRRGPGADPGHVGQIISFGWPRNTLVFSWRRWLELGRSGSVCVGCCLHDSNVEKLVDDG